MMFNPALPQPAVTCSWPASASSWRGSSANASAWWLPTSVIPKFFGFFWFWPPQQNSSQNPPKIQLGKVQESPPKSQQRKIHIPQKTNLAGWKITIFNRKYIFEWWIFHLVMLVFWKLPPTKTALPSPKQGGGVHFFLGGNKNTAKVPIKTTHRKVPSKRHEAIKPGRSLWHIHVAGGSENQVVTTFFSCLFRFPMDWNRRPKL